MTVTCNRCRCSTVAQHSGVRSLLLCSIILSSFYLDTHNVRFYPSSFFAASRLQSESLAFLNSSFVSFFFRPFPPQWARSIFSPFMNYFFTVFIDRTLIGSLHLVCQCSILITLLCPLPSLPLVISSSSSINNN